MLLSVTGFAGSGKDTIADYLIAEHGFKRESFAGALKDAVASIFGWDRELLEGRSTEGRAWRDKPDVWWSERLGIPELTPRWVLQQWGTEVCRHGFHDDIWIASLQHKILQTNQNVVISDSRFPNEIATVRNLGGLAIRVIRGEEPEWWQVAKETVQAKTNGTEQHLHETGKDMQTLYPNIHFSEWAWSMVEFDGIVYNNSTINDLHDSIEFLLSNIRN